MTMKRMGALFAFLCVFAPAQAQQEVKLVDVPPLQPLHYCKHSDGQVAYQSEPCGSDTTEVSSVTERKSDGTVTWLPLEKKEAADATEKSVAAESASKDDQHADAEKSPLSDFRKRIAKWLGFAVIVGLLAKLLKRSFILWSIFGFFLRAVLVAMNVMAF